MKTSKVKVVSEVKTWGEGDRKTYYHNLEMENGDKINIGKKKELTPGVELNYEIIGDLGQHEFTKAKSVNPEFQKKQQDKDQYIKGIEVGHAVNNAVNMLCAGLEFNNVPNDLTIGQRIEAYAQNIMLIAEKLKNEK